MPDQPRHIALERRLESEGWERDPSGDTGNTRAWRRPAGRADRCRLPVDVPLRPDFRDYDRRCNDVELAIERAAGRTWHALREVERERRRREAAVEDAGVAWEECARLTRERDRILAERNAVAQAAEERDGKWIWSDTPGDDLESMSDDMVVTMTARQLRAEVRRETKRLSELHDWSEAARGVALLEVERLRARCERLERVARRTSAASALAELRAALDEADGTGPERSETEQLRARNEELRRQLAAQQQNNTRRNRQLDALHLVWCNGGCETGVHRWTDETVTEELVREAERNTARLRAWWENRRRSSGTEPQRGGS